MPLIIADRVLEASTTTGTGVFTLTGASLGFRSFASVCSVADTVWYYIEGVNSFGVPTGEYEYGLGTYSGANQLTRTTVRGSSNGGSAVNFTAGAKLVGISPMAPSNTATKDEWRALLGVLTGTATNDSAAAGQIGEFASAVVPYASRASLSTGAALNVTSLSLTAGDWDVEGAVLFQSSTGDVSFALGSLNTTSATPSPSDAQTGWHSGLVSTFYQSVITPTVRFSLAATTTVYLVSRCDFNTGSATTWGSIRARRVR